jgi:formylglycine-generating enzyme required for sulfatase activity
MGSNPSCFQGENLPVESVSWFDAVKYCNAQSERDGLVPTYTINGEQVTWNRRASGYRLLTEAEWEYACRAGTTTPFSTGSNITTQLANYDGNSPYNNSAKGESRQMAVAVGRFAPNAWGLYDMHGNVWEWCWDWYASYTAGNPADPPGPSSGVTRILRGGSWYDSGQALRSATRGSDTPVARYYNLGFRIARSCF